MEGLSGGFSQGGPGGPFSQPGFFSQTPGEATQMDNVEMIDQTESALDTQEAVEPFAPEPWLRLVPRDGREPINLLMEEESTESNFCTSNGGGDGNSKSIGSSDNGGGDGNSKSIGSSDNGGKPGRRLYTHKVGRSRKCQTVMKEQRISNIHCQLFCKKNVLTGELEAWIEDTSANGTWLKRASDDKSFVKLVKNTPKALQNGDELYLINPSRIEDSRNGDEDSRVALNRNSFIVMILCGDKSRAKTHVGAVTSSNSTLFDKVIIQQRPQQQVQEQNRNPNPNYHRNANLTRPSSMMTRSCRKAMDMINQERDVLEHYQFGKELGRGSQATVYLARHKYTGVTRAIKAIFIGKLAQNKSDSDRLATILKEADFLIKMRHPSITRLEDVFADRNNYVYLVMEYLPGGDLYDRIVKKGRYPESQAKIVMTRILAGVKYMHARNVVHRDIKPENILMISEDDDTDVKITDFGLAKRTDNGLYRPKSVVGTPAYFAPEILARQHSIAGTGSYSVEADLWSCGVLMYVLLAGQYPWNNEESLASVIPAAKYSFDLPCWRNVSEPAKDLIRSLLVPEPQERLTASQALKHHWFADPALEVVRLALDGSHAGRSASASSQSQMDVSDAGQSQNDGHHYSNWSMNGLHTTNLTDSQLSESQGEMVTANEVESAPSELTSQIPMQVSVEKYPQRASSRKGLFASVNASHSQTQTRSATTRTSGSFAATEACTSPRIDLHEATETQTKGGTPLELVDLTMSSQESLANSHTLAAPLSALTNVAKRNRVTKVAGSGKGISRCSVSKAKSALLAKEKTKVSSRSATSTMGIYLSYQTNRNGGSDGSNMSNGSAIKKKILTESVISGQTDGGHREDSVAVMTEFNRTPNSGYHPGANSRNKPRKRPNEKVVRLNTKQMISSPAGSYKRAKRNM